MSAAATSKMKSVEPTTSEAGRLNRSTSVDSGNQGPGRRKSFAHRLSLAATRTIYNQRLVRGIDNGYEMIKSLLTHQFYKLGKMAGTHPVIFSLSPLFICLGLGMGMFNWQENKDTENQFTPIGSQIFIDRPRLKTLFPDSTGYNFDVFGVSDFPKHAIVVFRHGGKDTSYQYDYMPANINKHGKNESVFRKDILKQIRAIVDDFKAITIKDGGKSYNVQDLCARSANNACVVDGDFLLEDNFEMILDAGMATYPYFHINNVTVIDLSFFMVGVKMNVRNTIEKARVIKIRFYWKVAEDKHALMWNKKFLKVAQNWSRNLQDGLDMSYSTSESLEVELLLGTASEKIYFVLTLVLMVCYSVLVSTGGDAVSTRALLACGGVLAAALGIFSAMGLLLMCGVEYVNFVGIMPFLVLGIGVDDMFLLMSAWGESIGANVDVPKRVGLTFSKAGIGITITTLTDFLAFLIGINSVFVAVRQFCIFTALAVLFCYLANVSLFGACLSLHGDRVYNKKHCLTCKPVESRQHYRDAGANTCTVYCCGGSIPTRAFEDESYLEKLPRVLLPKIVLHPIMKIVVLCCFAGYLAWAIYGAVQLKPGMRYADLVLRTSYYYKYSAWEDEYYGQRLAIGLIVDQEINYGGMEGDRYRRMINQVQRDPMFNDGEMTYLRCWLHSYSRSPFYPPTRADAQDKTKFVTGLKTFLSHYNVTYNDIHFDETGTKIEASRCYVLTINEVNIFEQAEMMKRVRAIVASVKEFQVFCFQPVFVMLEHTNEIMSSTLQTVGTAVMVMFVVTLMMLPQLLMVSLVTLNIMIILTGVFGSMYWLDIGFSGLSMIFILMSVGFSVDFSAHICTAYLMCDSPTRVERARYALVHASGPIFNGGMTSLLGVSTLLLSESFFFRVFFMIMSMVIIAGAINSVFFMPIVLSMIGPQNLSEEQIKKLLQDEVEIDSPGVSLAAANLLTKVRKMESRGKDATFERLKIQVELHSALQRQSSKISANQGSDVSGTGSVTDLRVPPQPKPNVGSDVDGRV